MDLKTHRKLVDKWKDYFKTNKQKEHVVENNLSITDLFILISFLIIIVVTFVFL